MPLPPNFLSPEDQAEYDAYMSRFSEINHYYDYHTVPVIDWFFKQATEALHHERHCCKVSDEAAFCLIQRPYISKTLLTRRISPR
ncbi:hypothetical protein ACP5N4_15650, partial [Salmonella enterica]